MKSESFNKYISLVFLFNCLFALCVDLSHDEAYYWIYSLSFSFGHFDHPPMVGWVIKMGTLLWGKNEFGVRFFFNVMQVICLHELWSLSNKKQPKLFIYIFLAFPLVFASGILALPDTPLLFFAILFLKYFNRYLEKDDLKNSLILACVIALLFYSKYHGAVVVLFSVAAFPKIIMRKSFWLVFAVSFALFMPHLLWQIEHDFETFKYHLFKRKQRVMELGNLVHYVGSQVLVAGFLAFPIVIKALIKKSNDNVNKLIKYNVLGLYGLILISALRNKIEANWTVTSCGFLILLIYKYLSESEKDQKLFKFLVAPSVIANIILFVGLLVIPEGAIKDLDRLAEIRGWREKVSKIIERSPNKKIAANTYQLGGKLNFYTDLKVPVYHYQVRKSEFLHVKGFPVYNENEEITFVAYDDWGNGEKIAIGFPPNAFVHSMVTRKELLKHGPKNKQ